MPGEPPHRSVPGNEPWTACVLDGKLLEDAFVLRDTLYSQV